ncbi:2'-5' RNA ligase family protein, partial [Candidatus Bipolaricaulota bacterium]|nr:2'-5' RNA ligase family protein [Candidatus Bipolaricaulota bacterium]
CWPISPPWKSSSLTLATSAAALFFLGVTPTQSLIALHRRLFEASLPDATAPWIDLYCPGRWVPHCTVALRIPDDSLGMVIREVRNLIATPLLAQCMAVELLEVHEDCVQVIKRIELQLRES